MKDSEHLDDIRMIQERVDFDFAHDKLFRVEPFDLFLVQDFQGDDVSAFLFSCEIDVTEASVAEFGSHFEVVDGELLQVDGDAGIRQFALNVLRLHDLFL